MIDGKDPGANRYRVRRHHLTLAFEVEWCMDGNWLLVFSGTEAGANGYLRDRLGDLEKLERGL